MPRILEKISPCTMKWARVDAGYRTIERAAKKLCQAAERIRGWEEGKKLPTAAQLREVAKTYHRPICFFYLKEVPEQFKIQRPVDFRHLSSDVHERWTPNLMLMIRQAHDRQDWARELLGDEAGSQNWVASVDEGSDPKALAKKIRNWLGISEQKQRGFSNPGGFLNELVRLAENRGVFVSRHRPDQNRYRSIEPEIFRGIALKDAVAPLVVINPKDAIRGQIFTLLHELAHLWMDAPGLSNREPDKREDTRNRRIEVACNRIAAQVLMPKNWFLAEWKKCSGLSDDAMRIKEVAGVFSVSRESVARRRLDEGEITWNQYIEFRKRYQEDWRAEKARKKEQASQKSRFGGMASGLRICLENGKKLARLALENYQDQEISAIEVSRALNMKVAHLGKLAKAVDIDLPDWRDV